MFRLAGDDMFAARLMGMGCAFNREVIGFGGARGKDDFARIGVDQFGDLIAGNIDRFFRLPAKTVRSRSRITERAIQRQKLHHFAGHTRIGRRGGGIIQVNR